MRTRNIASVVTSKKFVQIGSLALGLTVLIPGIAIAQVVQRIVGEPDGVLLSALQDDDPFGEAVTPAEAKEAEAKAAAEKEAAAKDKAAAAEKAKAAAKEGAKPAADDKKAVAPPTADGEATKDDAKPTEPATDDPMPDDDAIEVSPMTPMVDPDTVKVYLGDGSIVTGKLTMQEIAMATEFGELSIPVTKILSFTPGLDSTPKLGQQIAQSIEALGSNDFKARDQAQRDLLALGTAVRTELARHTGDANAERVKRVREIMTKLDEMAEESEDPSAAKSAWARGDTIVTDEFTVVGKILPQEFTFESKYGILGVALADIRTMKRDVGGGPTEIRKSFTVEGQHLATTSFKDAKVRVEPGDKVTITAGGKITMTPWGSRSTVGPDGNQRYGSMSLDGQNYAGGTLIGKVSGGKSFKVGSNHSFTVDKAGSLTFAVAVNPSYGGGNYSFPGQYDLKIKVVRSNAK